MGGEEGGSDDSELNIGRMREKKFKFANLIQ